jgi:hypothetical protein
VVIRIDRQRVDARSGNERIVGRDGPRRGRAAAVRRLPDTAADRRRVGHDRALRRGGRIDPDVVDPAGGGAVVEATAAAGHPLGQRAESGKAAVAERQRIDPQRIAGRLDVALARHAALDARILFRRLTHPLRLVAEGGIALAHRPVNLRLQQPFAIAILTSLGKLGFGGSRRNDAAGSRAIGDSVFLIAVGGLQRMQARTGRRRGHFGSDPERAGFVGRRQQSLPTATGSAIDDDAHRLAWSPVRADEANGLTGRVASLLSGDRRAGVFSEGLGDQGRGDEYE